MIYPHLVTEWPKMPTAPLPPELTVLPTIVAEPWFQIEAPRPRPTLEGSVFDRDGNLIVCYREHPWSQIIRISPKRELEVVYRNENAVFTGAAVHRDGRIFVADLERGRILVLGPDGTPERELLEQYAQKQIHPNDLAFDLQGNLYVSDFDGSWGNPAGGIYRIDAEGDYTQFHLVADKLNRPNGVAFSPDNTILWTSESVEGTVVRIVLDASGQKRPLFLSCLATYRSSGFEPIDSCRCDSQGNVYQAFQYGGRLLVLDSRGVPIGNVVVPDRGNGGCMSTPSLAIKPGTSEGYLIGSGPTGSWVFTFPALAQAQVTFTDL